MALAMTAPPTIYDTEFDAAMREAGLRQVDLSRLAGVDRRTVWRWRSTTDPTYTPPNYAWSIIRLQKQVRELTAAQFG